MDLNDTQCPACGASALTYQADAVNDDQINTGAISCQQCGKAYDSIWGVPYLGTFKQTEVLSLIEIAANAASYRRKTNRDIDYLFWINLVEAYTNSNDKEAVLASSGVTEKPSWFDYRYSENILFKVLTQEIDLKGKHVLDIGAGSGYDSLKFYAAGAAVTCLEFNPMLCAVGKQCSPQLRWFGGSADTLPFADAQFDLVTANAALHHLVDIPQALQECLRVLKPGGYLITVGDPFMPDSSTEEQEALIFNQHTDVLMGVNEQVPRFSLFFDTFRRYHASLEIRVLTKSIYGLYPYPKEWTFEEVNQSFPNLSGDVQFLVKKKSHDSYPKNKMREGVISPALYATSLEQGTSSIELLANLLPKQFLNLPLLDQQHPKFRLLNGWQIQQNEVDYRLAYKRARLFFSGDYLQAKLFVSLLIPYQSDYDSPIFEIQLQDKIIYTQELIRGLWHDLLVPLDVSIEQQQNFVLELRLKTKRNSPQSHYFKVKAIQFVANDNQLTPPESAALEYKFSDYGVETVALTTLKDQPSITLLLSHDFEHSFDVINRLKKYQETLLLIVPERQAYFYSWIPGCQIVETYPYPCLEQQLRQLQHKAQLIVAKDMEFLHLLSGYVCNDSMHVVQSEGQCCRFSDLQLDNLVAKSEPQQSSGLATDDKTESSQQQSSLQPSQENAVELRQSQAQVKRLQKKLKGLQRELQNSQADIAAMKTSKFWKLRAQWFKLKTLLGLS